jgi:hypothetical protein
MSYKAVQITPNTFLVSMKIGQLAAHNCLDPDLVDNATQAQLKQNPSLSAAANHRGDNQRKWTKARKQRRDQYAAYIYGVSEEGSNGGYPPVTMWTTEDCYFHPDRGELDIPFSATLAATDGETQLSALFKLAHANSKWLDKTFAVVLHTECSRENADQMLHDMNHYANPVSEKDMALHNRQGFLTSAIYIGIDAAPLDMTSINRKTDSVMPKKTGGFKYATTVPRLLHGVVGAVFSNEALNKAPRALIEKGNSQGFTVDDSVRATAAAFVVDILSVEHDTLATYSKEYMLACGAYYARHKALPAAPDLTALETLDEQLTASKGGKRATAQEKAANYFSKM